MPSRTTQKRKLGHVRLLLLQQLLSPFRRLVRRVRSRLRAIAIFQWAGTRTMIIRFQPAKSTGTKRSTRTGLIFAHCTMPRRSSGVKREKKRENIAEKTHKKVRQQWTAKKKTENPAKPCDLDPPHTSTQTPRRVWEKRFPLNSFLSQRKTTLLVGRHIYADLYFSTEESACPDEKGILCANKFVRVSPGMWLTKKTLVYIL